MESLTKQIDDVKVTLKSVKRNNSYKCRADFTCEKCRLKNELSIAPTTDKLIATEALFNIRNTSSVPWPLQTSSWQLIDSDGYAYRARIFCYQLQPPRTARVDVNDHVGPGTQNDFVLVFPELEKNKEVGAILYSKGHSSQIFEINAINQIAIKSIKESGDTVSEVNINVPETDINDWELKTMARRLDRLELLIYSRLNNVLIPKEAITYENDIRQQTFQITQELKFFNEKVRKIFKERFDSIVASYPMQLEIVKARENDRKKLDQKVAQLYQLDPREFEEYITDLFIALGYENVTLTPYVNDKGVDILAMHNGIKVAIQCKKYKGVVGSPDIQTFLGAMHNAQAQKGFFVTTSVFSVEAEKMASENPIELIDGIALADLIQKALEKG